MRETNTLLAAAAFVLAACDHDTGRTITARVGVAHFTDEVAQPVVAPPLPQNDAGFFGASRFFGTGGLLVDGGAAYRYFAPLPADSALQGSSNASSNGTIVPSVPDGKYLLYASPPGFGFTQSVITLFEGSSSTPDLSAVTPLRPGQSNVTFNVGVNLSLSGLAPWTAQSLLPGGTGFDPFSGDRLQATSARVFIDQTFTCCLAGATSTSTSSPLSLGPAPALLPDAAAGDQVSVQQLVFSTPTPVSGATPAIVRTARKFAEQPVTLASVGLAQPLSFALADVPLVAALPAKVGYTAFEALAQDAGPAGATSRTSYRAVVEGYPRSITYPDAPYPSLSARPVLLELVSDLSKVAAPADTDYGSLQYGRYAAAPRFAEALEQAYVFTIHLPGMPSGTLVDATAAYTSLDAVSGTALAPRISAPRAILIDGKDAMAPQVAASATPTFTWSPPALGTATSYSVSVYATQSGFTTNTPDARATLVVSARVRGTSFRVPAVNYNSSFNRYYAKVTAISAPWDTPDAPLFRTGAGLASMDAVTAAFSLP